MGGELAQLRRGVIELGLGVAGDVGGLVEAFFGGVVEELGAFGGAGGGVESGLIACPVELDLLDLASAGGGQGQGGVDDVGSGGRDGVDLVASAGQKLGFGPCHLAGGAVPVGPGGVLGGGLAAVLA